MKPTYLSGLIICVLLIFSSTLWAEENGADKRTPHVMTFGEMLLAIGQRQHQGRVLLQELVNREHFYGMGALTGLKGEITICDGEFQYVRLHMINGARPVHARIHKQDLPKDRQPVEGAFSRIKGTVVGVYAKDVVGKRPPASRHTCISFSKTTQVTQS